MKTYFVLFAAGQRPFKITFITDANEVQLDVADAKLDEEAVFPGGIIGFSLDYAQQSC